MIGTLLAVLVGLVGLALGADVLLRGVMVIARRLGISPLITGVAIVGSATSMPEMVASVQAALAGSSAIAWGNIIGSNIANALLILGLAALVAPIRLRGIGKSDAAAGVVFGLAVWAMAALGFASRLAGLALISALVLYLVWRIRAMPADLAPAAQKPEKLWLALVQFAGGLAALILGGRLLVDGAIDLAELAGVSQAAIGVTVVAVGTSLPELAASVIAALRGRPELAVGNVVGSNIFNLLMIGGVTMTIAPMPIAPELLPVQFPVMLVSMVVVWLLCRHAKRLWRIPAALLVGGFALNVALVLGQ